MSTQEERAERRKLHEEREWMERLARERVSPSRYARLGRITVAAVIERLRDLGADKPYSRVDKQAVADEFRIPLGMVIEIWRDRKYAERIASSATLHYRWRIAETRDRGYRAPLAEDPLAELQPEPEVPMPSNARSSPRGSAT